MITMLTSGVAGCYYIEAERVKTQAAFEERDRQLAERDRQAVTNELDKYDGDERRHMTERVQQLLDAVAMQHGAGCRDEVPAQRNDEPPPH